MAKHPEIERLEGHSKSNLAKWCVAKDQMIAELRTDERAAFVAGYNAGYLSSQFGEPDTGECWEVYLRVKKYKLGEDG